MPPRVQLIGVQKRLSGTKVIPTLFQLIKNRPSSNLRQVLKNIDLEIGPGEILELIGDNGAGKSTLLRLVAGIYQPDLGEIRIRGRVLPLLALDSDYHPNLSLRKYFGLLVDIHSYSDLDREVAIDRLLKYAGLSERENESVRRLSPGLIARCLAGLAEAVRPDVLLLDEILSQCDSHTFQMWMEQLENCRRRGGAGIVVFHGFSCAEISDRRVKIEAGRLVECQANF